MIGETQNSLLITCRLQTLGLSTETTWLVWKIYRTKFQEILRRLEEALVVAAGAAFFAGILGFFPKNVAGYEENLAFYDRMQALVAYLEK